MSSSSETQVNVDTEEESSVQTLEESEEDEQGGEEDEEDEEEEEIDEDHWVVEKVQEMRYNGKLKRVEFLVLWQADKSTSWEPIENFHGGYENLEIQRFQTEHPKRFEDVTNKATVANKKGRPKKQQTWITKDIDDDIYEKPDESAQGEAKRLADPNRLQDPSEKFLKTYGVGIEGRVSRSKTRDIRRTIEMSSADSSPSVRNRSPVPVEKEKKQKKPRGGKKKEAEAVALHSTPPPPVRRTRTASAPVQALVRPKRNASSTTPVATSSAGISQGGLSSPTAPMMNVPASSAMTSSSNCSTVVPLSSASSNSSTSGHRAHDCVPRAVFDALLAENAGLKSQLLEIKKILN